MVKTDSVWVSALPKDGSMVETKLGFDREEPARKAISSGGDPRPKDLPIIAFEKYYDGPISDLPPIFDGASGIVISHELAEPFLRFDLGRTLVLPLRLFRYDKTTEFFSERGYHIILRYEVFKALASDACENIRAAGSANPPKRWALPRLHPLEDDDVAVNTNALDSPAYWWDPALYDTHFINGEVVKAMQETDTAKYWHLKRCRIIEKSD